MVAKLGHVEPFNVQTDDWSLYIERLRLYFVANDITVDKKKGCGPSDGDGKQGVRTAS